MAVIFDLDDTLADITHRVQNPIKDWEVFFSKADKDSPKKNVIDLCNKLYENNYLVILTGRPERYRKLTEDWLSKYGVNYNELIMRSDNDRRKDFLYKEEKLKKFPKVLAVFDNSQTIGIMCKKNGYQFYLII